MTNLKRMFRYGFISFWRSALVSLASVITITATLFVVGSLWLSSAYLNSVLEEVKNQVDISVSMKPDVPESEVLELQKKLELLPEVKSVTYSSREQELAIFEKNNENNDTILQSLKEVGNPFGASLKIQAVDPSRYESVAKFLESDSVSVSGGETIVDQVSFKANVVDRLIKIIATAKTIGWAIVSVLIFISVIVTFNTVSLAIYVSREEISLMKLVGAGNNYIRGPFVVEGLISGGVAALLALALLYPAAIWVRNVTAPVFGGVDLVSYFLNNIIQILLLLLIVGVFLGIVSSFLAVRKHLKK